MMHGPINIRITGLVVINFETVKPCVWVSLIEIAEKCEYALGGIRIHDPSVRVERTAQLP